MEGPPELGKERSQVNKFVSGSKDIRNILNHSKLYSERQYLEFSIMHTGSLRVL